MKSIENLLSQTINISEIPALPEAARWAIYKTLTLEKSAEEISYIIKSNPSLTLKILKIANSPIYTRRTPVSSIKDAIVLLGYKTIKGIILSVTIKDIFAGKETAWFNYKGFWLHSIATAIVSEEIAKILKHPSEDIAYAAGLLHDIGKIIFLLSTEERYKEVIDTIGKEKLSFNRAEMKTFGFDHTDVSEFLFEYWELPYKLTIPIHEHHKEDFSPLVKQGVGSLILKIANEIAHIAGFTTQLTEPTYEVSEDILIQLGLLSEDLDLILQNLKANIATLVEILNLPQTDVKGYFEMLSSANRELGKMHITNQQMVKEIKTKKNIVTELNKISLLFLKERDIETVLGEALRTILRCFKFNSVYLEFYLNNESSIMYKIFYPKLFTEDGKIIISLEIEENKKLIKRGSIKFSEAETADSAAVYSLDTGNGLELGKLYIEAETKPDSQDLRTFLDQFTLGLNNMKLLLTNKIKTEKLNIAVKQLKDENEARLRFSQINKLILDNSPNGIISIYEEGKIITGNRKAEKIFRENLKNKNFYNLGIFVQNNLQAAVENLVEQKKDGDLTVTIEGKNRIFHISITPIKGTDQLLVLVDDITERLENEKIVIQKEKMATLGELAAGIAHNLRSPLAVIKGIPELILSDLQNKNLRVLRKIDRKEKEDKEIIENMELISKSMQKAFAIIESIMDFSKMETGKFETLELSQAVNEALFLLEHRVKEKNIKFINNTHNCTLSGNKNMMIQIFLNLLNNSIDAIKDTGTIKVNYRKEKDKIIIHFIDNGRGIEKDDIERIFEPFYTTSGRANGTGVGLSITRTMVTIHGGSIKALQGRDGGTIMEITFPVSGK